MFRGGVQWRSLKGRIRIHLPCHTSPLKNRQVHNTMPLFWKKKKKRHIQSFLTSVKPMLSLAYFGVTFSQPPSSKLTSSAHYLCEESVQFTSYLAFLSFFKFFSCYQEIFFKKVQSNTLLIIIIIKKWCNIIKQVFLCLLYGAFDFK